MQRDTERSKKGVQMDIEKGVERYRGAWRGAQTSVERYKGHREVQKGVERHGGA